MVESKNSVSSISIPGEVEIPKSTIVISVLFSNAEQLSLHKCHLSITHKEHVLINSACDITENLFVTLNGEIEFDSSDINVLSELIDNPLLVLVQEMYDPLKAKKGVKGGTNIKINNSGLQPIGYSNIDLFPLFQDTDCIEEIVMLQPLTDFSSIDMRSWPNLATLKLRVTIEKNENFDYDFINSLNVVTLTMESLMNVPNTVSDFEGLISTCLPIENQESINEEISFLMGFEELTYPMETLRKWATLCHIEGRGKMSSVKICTKKPVNKHNIKLETENTPSSIVWNSFHRLFVSPNDMKAIKNFITEKHSWPIEIYLKAKFQPKAKPGQKNDLSNQVHLMAFPEVFKLLYGGECSVRVACPVYIFNQDYMNLRGGFTSFLSKETSTIKIDKNKISSQSVIDVREDSEEVDVIQCEQYFNDDQPVYLLIDVDVLKPLNKRKTEEEILEDIQMLIPERVENIEIETAHDAKRKYHQCIKESMALLNNEYDRFLQNYNTFSYKANGDDELSGFTRYLRTTGAHARIFEKFSDSISLLINNNYKVCQSTVNKDQFQEFISRVYIELVREMHNVVKTSKQPIFIPNIESKNLLYFAREEEALNHLVDAERLHLQYISLNENDVQAWFYLSLHYIKSGNNSSALTALFEVIRRKPRHKLGLLLYGILLMYKGDIKDAEKFLLAAVTFYPKFCEGFVAISLFYKKIENFEFSGYTMDMAKQIVSENLRCSCKNPLCTCDNDELMFQEEFVWYDKDIPENSLYLKTAAVFLRLRLFELVEMILAEELIEQGQSIYYDYLMAVRHYYNESYSDALMHIQKDSYEIQNTYLISSLEGHCLDALNRNEEALQAFELTNLCFDRPNDIHLVFIKLGQHYLNLCNYDLAKKMFITCCNFSPTPMSWLGAGIAFMKLQLHEECERCLIEANFLDRHNPYVWAYLAIMNIIKKNTEQFTKCYVMALKNGLKDEKVLSELNDFISDPDLFPEEAPNSQTNLFVF